MIDPFADYHWAQQTTFGRFWRGQIRGEFGRAIFSGSSFADLVNSHQFSAFSAVSGDVGALVFTVDASRLLIEVY